MSTARLLLDRRFWPLFWVQFLTAFNDNVLKMGLVLLVTYGALLYGEPITVLGLGADALNSLGGLLLMLPFLLFSAFAGQLADRYPKHRVMRRVKLLEVGLMGFAAVGFGMAALGLPGPAGAALLALVFFMGTQSALFGPIKYSLLPQVLTGPGELVAGNALIETGTYLSVLLGTLSATGLYLLPRAFGLPPTAGLWVLGGGVLVFAVLGWLAALASPPVPAEAPDLRLRLEPFTASIRAVRTLTDDPGLRFPALANSWFWALAAAVLALLPTWSARVLGADEATFTLFMVLFSVGIGGGSLLCARWSRGRIELGLVALGALGITVFLVDLALNPGLPPLAEAADPRGIPDLLATVAGWRVVVDLLLLAASGGIFMVPLYAAVQDRATEGSRSQAIGGLNLLNGLFMVAVLAVQTGLLAFGATERVLLGILAVLAAGWFVATVVALRTRVIRFTGELLARSVYRLRVHGRDHVPAEGAAIVISNHVSFIDWLIVMAALPRPHRFVIWHAFHELPLIKPFTTAYEVIPITNDPKARRLILAAFKRIEQSIAEEQLVVIFPEGALPYTPELQPFLRGLEMVLKRSPAPVVPVAINGLWGSFYSRKGGQAFRSWRPPWRTVHVTIGEPIQADGRTIAELREAVADLWARHPDLP